MTGKMSVKCCMVKCSKDIVHRGKDQNLEPSIVGSLTVHFVHLFLCSVDPSVHFLNPSIQLLHLPLVVLTSEEREERYRNR